MSRPGKLALISIVLNIVSLLVYSIVVSEAVFQQFALATEILSLMGVTALTLRQEEEQPVRKIAWISLAIAIGIILVIGILLLDIYVLN